VLKCSVPTPSWRCLSNREHGQCIAVEEPIWHAFALGYSAVSRCIEGRPHVSRCSVGDEALHLGSLIGLTRATRQVSSVASFASTPVRCGSSCRVSKPLLLDSKLLPRSRDSEIATSCPAASVAPRCHCILRRNDHQRSRLPFSAETQCRACVSRKTADFHQRRAAAAEAHAKASDEYIHWKQIGSGVRTRCAPDQLLKKFGPLSEGDKRTR